MNHLDRFSEYLAQSFNVPSIPALSVHDEDFTTTDSWIAHLHKTLSTAPVAVGYSARTSAQDLRRELTATGLTVLFAGWFTERGRDLAIAVVSASPHLLPKKAPRHFRVTAIVPVYNEEDILRQTLDHLAAQNIDAYVLDNWSTDSSYQIARDRLGYGVIAHGRFPANGPAQHFEWRRILTHIEHLAASIDSDWIVLHDADERRESPWPEWTYRDALFTADQAGYNCLDHVVLNFHPTQRQFHPLLPLHTQLTACAFSCHPGHYHQRKAWKNDGPVSGLAASAGHDVRLRNRRIYPFKCLMRHYPLRSFDHAQQKIFRDRQPRWDPQERAAGWHAQYDEASDASSLPAPAGLFSFDSASFYERFLLQRLSAVGVFERTPEYATPPYVAPFMERPALAIA